VVERNPDNADDITMPLVPNRIEKNITFDKYYDIDFNKTNISRPYI